MSASFSLKKSHELSRILMILLIAFCVIEGFFLWLILFPNAQENLANVDSDFSENISETREVNTAEILQEIDKKQRLEKWQQFSSELTERYTNKNYAIAFANINEPDFSLEINANQEFIAASTYKLFAAYAMFQTGSPPECLDTMIIDSDNDCPQTFLRSYGWSKLTQDAKSIGAEHTYFDADTHTTANDLIVILRQIYDGTLLSKENNTRLINDMKQQVYRNGIPAGIPEAEVADKVGFLDDLLHDAGIVYSPKGDFILAILTDGYSWNSIAETASEIYNHL